MTCEAFKLLLQQIQTMPSAPVTAEQCSDFSFWLSKTLPAPYETKQALLECESLHQRMEKITQILQDYENPHRCIILWTHCNIDDFAFSLVFVKYANV